MSVLTQYRSDNKIGKNEMSGTYGAYGERRGVYRVLVENLRETDHLGDPAVDGVMILKCIFRKWDVGLECIELAQDRDACQALVNEVINLLWIPQNAENFLTN